MKLTCEDCIHYGICIFHLKGNENKDCLHFKSDAMKWIPVTERLPEEPLQTVIVTNGNETCVAVYDVVYDEFGVMCGKGKTFGVTHWMPLPPATKEDK